MKTSNYLGQQQAEETLRLEIAYSNLYRAYLTNNRDEMIASYIAAGYVNISNFRDRVLSECRKVFYKNGRIPDNITYPIEQMSFEQLKLNVIGCLNALQFSQESRSPG